MVQKKEKEENAMKTNKEIQMQQEGVEKEDKEAWEKESKKSQVAIDRKCTFGKGKENLDRSKIKVAETWIDPKKNFNKIKCS